MALNDPVSGGEEAAKAPMERDKSMLGSTVDKKTRRILTDDQGRILTVIAEDQTGDLLEVGVLSQGQTAPIADNVDTSILTYTAIGGPKKISCIAVSGEAAADFWFEVNTSQSGIRRTTHDRLSDNFVFGGNFTLAQNDVLVVKVNHCATGKTKIFEATVYGV